jgi:hypothetical protein
MQPQPAAPAPWLFEDPVLNRASRVRSFRGASLPAPFEPTVPRGDDPLPEPLAAGIACGFAHIEGGENGGRVDRGAGPRGVPAGCAG